MVHCDSDSVFTKLRIRNPEHRYVSVLGDKLLPRIERVGFATVAALAFLFGHIGL